MQKPSYIRAREALNELPFLAEIKSEEDYGQALMLMDEMADEYEANLLLIGILSMSIEKWENEAAELSLFNREVDSMNAGIAVLKTLMDQHGLSASDLPEIGTKSNVSKILNGIGGKRLTRRHIELLSKRFHISPAVFLN